MTEAEETRYSEKLLKLARRCPSCGTLMKATGRMRYDAAASDWFVEYWCAKEREAREIFTPETGKLTKEIAEGS